MIFVCRGFHYHLFLIIPFSDHCLPCHWIIHQILLSRIVWKERQGQQRSAVEKHKAGPSEQEKALVSKWVLKKIAAISCKSWALDVYAAPPSLFWMQEQAPCGDNLSFCLNYENCTNMSSCHIIMKIEQSSYEIWNLMLGLRSAWLFISFGTPLLDICPWEPLEPFIQELQVVPHLYVFFSVSIFLVYLFLRSLAYQITALFSTFRATPPPFVRHRRDISTFLDILIVLKNIYFLRQII